MFTYSDIKEKKYYNARYVCIRKRENDQINMFVYNV